MSGCRSLDSVTRQECDFSRAHSRSDEGRTVVVYKGLRWWITEQKSILNNWIREGVNECKYVPQAVKDDRSQKIVGRCENESHQAAQEREREDSVHAEVKESKDHSAQDYG